MPEMWIMVGHHGCCHPGEPMKDATKPGHELNEALVRLRGAAAAAVSKLTSAIDHREIDGGWAAKLVGTLGGVEALISVALDPAKPQHRRKASILVVDDQESTRAMIQSLLQGSGYEVTEADCVKAAKKRLSAERFDLLVTDIHLPDGTGLAIAEFAKGCQAIDGRPLPVIAISADRDPEVVEAVQKIGAAWIAKEYLLTNLVGQIARSLLKPTAAQKNSGIINQRQVDSINTMINHDSARQIVSSSLSECSDLINRLRVAREKKRLQDWKEHCHALHGHADLLGAVRVSGILAAALRENEEHLEAHMARYERDLAKEMQSVRSFYDHDLLATDA